MGDELKFDFVKLHKKFIKLFDKYAVCENCHKNFKEDRKIHIVSSEMISICEDCVNQFIDHNPTLIRNLSLEGLVNKWPVMYKWKKTRQNIEDITDVPWANEMQCMVCLCVYTDEVWSCVSGHSVCMGCIILMKMHNGNQRLCRVCNQSDFEFENKILSAIAFGIAKYVRRWMNDHPKQAIDLVESGIFDSQIQGTNFIVRKGKFRCPIDVSCEKLPLQHVYYHLLSLHPTKYLLQEFLTQDVYLPEVNCYDLATIRPSEGPFDVAMKIKGLGLFAIHINWEKDEYVKKNYSLKTAVVVYLSGVHKAFQCTIYLQRSKILLKRTSICRHSDTEDTSTDTLHDHPVMSLGNIINANVIKQNYQFRVRLHIVQFNGDKIVIPNAKIENYYNYDELKS